MIHIHRKEHRSEDEAAELTEFVRERGWTHQQSDTESALRFVGGEPFPTRSNRLRTADLVTGTYRDRSFCCFEYRRRTASSGEAGRRRDYDYFRVFAVRTPTTGARLQVKRAGFGSKVLDAVGFEDLELGDAEFDEAFRVETDDETFARRLLGSYTMRWLLTDERAGERPFRFERDELVTWERARLTAPSIEPALDYLCDLLDRVH